MNRPLTNQQQAVYDFIRGRIVARGYGPTVREIGEFMNIKSPNGVMCHLRALERKGMLSRTANKSRAIELTEPVSRLMGGSLPIEGKIVAGTCSANSAPKEPLDVGELVAPDRYVLEVADDALVDLHIKSGDRIVVQKQTEATAGQLVVARTGENETSLRYWQAGQEKPVPLQVIGVVIGVIRLFPNVG